MRPQRLLLSLIFGSSAMVGNTRPPGPKLTRTKPAVFTIEVHHDECTECGDFEIEKGEVIVPIAMRERYVQALINLPRFGKQSDKRNRILAICNRNGYRVGNVKLEREEEFNSLFLLPGKHPSDYLKENPWDFNRRYRVTVTVTGIKWSYVAVRVQKAMRLADIKY